MTGGGLCGEEQPSSDDENVPLPVTINILLTTRPSDAASLFLPTVQNLTHRRRRSLSSSSPQKRRLAAKAPAIYLLSLQGDGDGEGRGNDDDDQQQQQLQNLARSLGIDGAAIAGHEQRKEGCCIVYGEENVSRVIHGYVEQLLIASSSLIASSTMTTVASAAEGQGETNVDSIAGQRRRRMANVVLIVPSAESRFCRPDLHSGVRRLLETQSSRTSSMFERGRLKAPHGNAQIEDKNGKKNGDDQAATNVRYCAWECQDDAATYYYHITYVPLLLLDWAYVLLMVVLTWATFLLGLEGHPWSWLATGRGNDVLCAFNAKDASTSSSQRVSYRLTHPRLVWDAIRPHQRVSAAAAAAAAAAALFRRSTYVNVLHPFRYSADDNVKVYDDDDDDVIYTHGKVSSELELTNKLPDVVIQDERASSPHGDIEYILSPQQIKLLAWKALPASVRTCRWTRLYSLSRDGDSFQTFLRNVRGAKRSLIVIRTTNGMCLGAYADSAWDDESQQRRGSFYGTGQTCLWEFVVEGRKNGAGGNDKRDAHDSDSSSFTLNVYKWTGINDMIQACQAQKRMLAFGGGGTSGTFGLCVKDDFLRGTSGPCDTFGNEQPLGGRGEFNVLDLECWGFLSAFA